MKRSPSNTFLRKYARMVDATIGADHIAHDSTAWLSIGFDLAAAADYYGGVLVNGYRPGMGSGSAGALSDLSANYGPHVRRFLARQRPEILATACALAYGYGTACEGRREHIRHYA